MLVGTAAALATPAIWGSARAQARELLVYSWFTNPMQAIMKDFAAETGAQVNFIGSYSGNPVWWSQMIAGEKWDVFLPSMDWMTRAALAERVEPLDLKRIPNFDNLSDSGKSAVEKELTVNGQVYGLPFALTINALAYNTNAVEKAKAEANWDVMWDPSFAGRLSTKDEAIIPILTAAARLDIPTEDIGAWTPTQYDALKASLLEQKKLVRKYWSNHEEMAEMLLTEQAVAGVWVDGRARQQASSGNPIGIAVPPQGVPAVIDTMAILKDAPNKDMAYEFINFILRPEQMVKIPDIHGAVVMSDKANALIPGEKKASFVIEPSWKYHWRRFTTPEVSQRLERLWTEVKLA